MGHLKCGPLHSLTHLPLNALIACAHKYMQVIALGARHSLPQVLFWTSIVVYLRLLVRVSVAKMSPFCLKCAGHHFKPYRTNDGRPLEWFVTVQSISILITAADEHNFHRSSLQNRQVANFRSGGQKYALTKSMIYGELGRLEWMRIRWLCAIFNNFKFIERRDHLTRRT